VVKNKIIELLREPYQMEQFYRSDGEAFSSLLKEAILVEPKSEILKAWDARINYTHSIKKLRQGKSLLIAVILSILTLCAIKVPLYAADFQFLSWLTAEWFYPRFTAMISVGALIAYFLLSKRPPINIVLAIFSALLLATLMMVFMPNTKNSSTIVMSYLHLPLFLMSVLALSFVGEEWRVHVKRLMFIKYI
jgi:peptidoglycan/LPS O-acetylase OafA/YrhL